MKHMTELDNALSVAGVHGTIETLVMVQSQYRQFLIQCDGDPNLSIAATRVFSVLRALEKALSQSTSLIVELPVQTDETPSQE